MNKLIWITVWYALIALVILYLLTEMDFNSEFSRKMADGITQIVNMLLAGIALGIGIIATKLLMKEETKKMK